MIDTTLPVRVYWNYKHRCYSIFQAGAVRASASEVRLRDVEFRVRESGRRKMLEQGRKVIHAFAVGLLVDHVHPDNQRTLEPLRGRRAFYNPVEHSHFVDTVTLQPVHYADLAQFGPDGVRYWSEQKLAA